eukprot:768576-Hanusia_phi.AAC.4
MQLDVSQSFDRPVDPDWTPAAKAFMSYSWTLKEEGGEEDTANRRGKADCCISLAASSEKIRQDELEYVHREAAESKRQTDKKRNQHGISCKVGAQRMGF